MTQLSVADHEPGMSIQTVTLTAPTETVVDMAEVSARFADAARFAAFDGLCAESLAERATPQAIAANTGRIYDFMHEIGLAAESDTREALFAFAAAALGVDYDVFYDAWLDQLPVTV